MPIPSAAFEKKVVEAAFEYLKVLKIILSNYLLNPAGERSRNRLGNLAYLPGKRRVLMAEMVVLEELAQRRRFRHLVSSRFDGGKVSHNDPSAVIYTTEVSPTCKVLRAASAFTASMMAEAWSANCGISDRSLTSAWSKSSRDVAGRRRRFARVDSAGQAGRVFNCTAVSRATATLSGELALRPPDRDRVGRPDELH